jgi:hypothetical protein
VRKCAPSKKSNMPQVNVIALYTMYSRSAFALLAFICAASVFFYGTFLLLAVGHTASRAHAATTVKELKGKLSVLEGHYLDSTQSLTPQYAASLGYVHPAEVATVYASTPTESLTINTLPPAH